MAQNNKEQNDYKLTYYNTISSRTVEWLWYPYIPYGKITILQGDPGEGKSTMMLQLAALITAGKAMPDGSGDKVPGNVIYQAAEDGIEDTIKPRLLAAGADCGRIAFLENGENPITLDDECKYRFRGQYSQEDDEQILLFDLLEPEVIKHELIQDNLTEGDVDETAAEGTSDTEEKSEKNVKTVIKTLFPEKWSNHFGYKVDEVVLLQRVHYCGNWDVLRPARTVEGMDIISEKLLEKLNDEAQYLIEKMRCAV